MNQRVEIISTGSPRTSRVLVDGEVLHGVQRVELTIDVATGRTDAWIRVLGVGTNVDLPREQAVIQEVPRAS